MPDVIVQGDDQVTVSTIGIQGESGQLSPISANIEVDATARTDGSVLVYKTATSKWTATTTLNAQNLEGGNY
jgi:hypothetical protein